MAGFPYNTGPDYNDPEFSKLVISSLQQSEIEIKQKITETTIKTYNISKNSLNKLVELGKPLVIKSGPVILLLLNRACYEVAPVESVSTIIGFTDAQIVDRLKLIGLKIGASPQIARTINSWYLSKLICAVLNNYIRKHPEISVPRCLRKVKENPKSFPKNKPWLILSGGEVDVDGVALWKTVLKRLLHVVYNPKGSNNKTTNISGDSKTIHVNEFDPVKLTVAILLGGIAGLNIDKLGKALIMIKSEIKQEENPYDSIRTICLPIGSGFGFLYKILIDENTPDAEKKERIFDLLSRINPEEGRVVFGRINLDEINQLTLLVDCLLVLLTFLFPIDIRSFTFLLDALFEAYISGRISRKTLKRILQKLIEKNIEIPPHLEEYAA